MTYANPVQTSLGKSCIQSFVNLGSIHWASTRSCWPMNSANMKEVVFLVRKSGTTRKTCEVSRRVSNLKQGTTNKLINKIMA